MDGNKGRAREGFPEEVSLRKSDQGFMGGSSEQRVFQKNCSVRGRWWQLRLEGNSCLEGSPWPLRT